MRLKAGKTQERNGVEHTNKWCKCLEANSSELTCFRRPSTHAATGRHGNDSVESSCELLLFQDLQTTERELMLVLGAKPRQDRVEKGNRVPQQHMLFPRYSLSISQSAMSPKALSAASNECMTGALDQPQTPPLIHV
jgi:hypothetical protein